MCERRERDYHYYSLALSDKTKERTQTVGGDVENEINDGSSSRGAAALYYG